MPPKKKVEKKEKKEKKPSSAKSKRSSTPSSKKSGGKKKKKQAPEGPVEWKLSKDRLEELKSLSLVPPAAKAQINADLEPLLKPFAARKPFKHWTLKSTEIPLMGIESSDACGVLCHTEPLYPMIDTADRRAIARCWRAIRLNFEPIGPPVGVADEEEEYDIFEGTGENSPFGSRTGSRPGTNMSRGLGGGEGDLVSGGGMAPSVDASVEGWVGPMTLYGMSRWLNNRGEKFPGSGYPYDEVVWKPLEVLILKTFRKSKDGFLRAKWKQPSLPPMQLQPLHNEANMTMNMMTQRQLSGDHLNVSNSNGGSGDMIDGNFGTISGLSHGTESEGGMFPTMHQTTMNDGLGYGTTMHTREDSIELDDEGLELPRRPQPPPWNARSALISSLTNENELIKMRYEVELPPGITNTPPATGRRRESGATNNLDSVPSTARSSKSASGTRSGGVAKKSKKAGGGGKKSKKGDTTPATPPGGLKSSLSKNDSSQDLAKIASALEEAEALEDIKAKILAAGPEVGRVIARIHEYQHPSHVNLADSAGNFAIAVAAERGCSQAVYLLAKAGCYLDAPGQAGNTALHVAASAGFVDIVKILIAAGADTSVQNSYGESPLHLASRYGHADIVKLLVAGGAPVSSWTNAHYNPMHFAAGGGHLPVLKLLEKAAASEGKTKAKKTTKGSTTKKKGSTVADTTATNASSTATGPASTVLNYNLGAPIEKATLNSLNHQMQPPIMRTVAALGGRSACQDPEVLKDPNNVTLAATLHYLGGKYKDPLATKGATKKEKGGDKSSGSTAAKPSTAKGKKKKR